MSLKTEIRANTAQAQAAFKKFCETLERVNTQGAKTADALKQIGEQSTYSNEKLKDIAKNTNKLTDRLAHSAQAFVGWKDIIKNTFGGTIQDILKTADAINTMNAKLKLTTTSTAHFEALKKSIDGIARATSSSTESISNLFINLNQSLSEMGLSGKQALEMSETLSKALKVGGASAIDAERAITQFSQALSTGKLQGQDFKAMIQAAPSLLKNMAGCAWRHNWRAKGYGKRGQAYKR